MCKSIAATISGGTIMNNKLKVQILKLKANGYTYKRIASEVHLS